jgi:hypothetical protein
VLVVSNFTQLFIGDLAFLAMLIGMNNSSGNHCPFFQMKGSEFNCPHTPQLLQTKQLLMLALEQCMLPAASTRKMTANCMGVNAKGLIDINQQHILIPVLHCPMALADKTLYSFKRHVNAR